MLQLSRHALKGFFGLNVLSGSSPSSSSSGTAFLSSFFVSVATACRRGAAWSGVGERSYYDRTFLTTGWGDDRGRAD